MRRQEALAVDGVIKHGLPPILGPQPRLLILGSLPGDASLAAERYYAHPRNQFWRLLGGAIGEPLEALDYEHRLDTLRRRRIALWDVIASAARRGSLDQAIRDASHNRLADLVEAHPSIAAVAFNGSTAAAAGRKLLSSSRTLEAVDLPSSSPANTQSLADKAAVWAQLARFCAP